MSTPAEPLKIKELKDKYGLTAEQGEDTEEGETKYEIFLGAPINRGDEYKLDGHDCGKSGYAVEIVGTKIVMKIKLQ